jgi:hypothetical protein
LKSTTEVVVDLGAAKIDLIHASANFTASGVRERWDRRPVLFSGALAVAAFHRVCLLCSNMFSTRRYFFERSFSVTSVCSVSDLFCCFFLLLRGADRCSREPQTEQTEIKMDTGCLTCYA